MTASVGIKLIISTPYVKLPHLIEKQDQQNSGRAINTGSFASLTVTGITSLLAYFTRKTVWKLTRGNVRVTGTVGKCCSWTKNNLNMACGYFPSFCGGALAS